MRYHQREPATPSRGLAGTRRRLSRRLRRVQQMSLTIHHTASDESDIPYSHISSNPSLYRYVSPSASEPSFIHPLKPFPNPNKRGQVLAPAHTVSPKPIINQANPLYIVTLTLRAENIFFHRIICILSLFKSIL